MTAVMHRRSLYEQGGGFDEELVRLVDWDLVLRFMDRSEPLIVPVLGGQYRMGSWPRISNQESHSLAIYQVRRKHLPRTNLSMRILYALQFFPQLSESFVTTEIAAMREQGVEIVVWSEHEPPVPYATDVTVLRGDLGEAIAKVRPRLVHVHNSYHALRYAPIAQAAGVSMTVRGHGFEFTEERLRALSQTSAIRAVFQFPHFITDRAFDGVDTTKLRAMTCCFNPDLYFPRGVPDHRLVVRAGIASPTKHLDAFIRTAAMCPRHRFVLAACWSVGYPDHLEELEALNRSLGEPVEILVNRPHAEVANLMRRAGIHLHTHALQEPYGMPVSIAESMAAGCYVIARRSPASAAFVADVGKTYDTEAEAIALVQETETWTSSQWAAARLASIERAFAHYGSPQVLRPLLEEWTSSPLGSFTASA
jgi:glycosyltransferase involved in cell wall biosynthesis